MGYWATVNGGDQLCRGWTFVAQKISEDDAIWNALKEFRREKTATWDGWPRDIFAVLVEPEIVRHQSFALLAIGAVDRRTIRTEPPLPIEALRRPMLRGG